MCDLYLFRYASLLVLTALSLTMQAQYSIELLNNVIREGDIVKKSACYYSSAGNGGEDVLWDFSEHLGTCSHFIHYSSDSTLRITGNNGKALYGYSIHGDSLLMVSYENPLEHISYTRPVLIMRYPMQYGDTFQQCFDGRGKYCESHFERVIGNIVSTADGYGRLILSEKDTLDNVLRVYTLKTSSIRIDIDSCKTDSDFLKQEIEEHYQWYARGYRYPVYETVSRTCYDNMEPVSVSQFALCCLPESQRELSDSLNEELARLPDEINTAPDIYHYHVEVQGDVINISYSLDGQARLRFIVADLAGMVHRQTERGNDAGDGYAMQIDCSTLPRRQYILYMNVNGKIYSEKVIIK